MNTQKRQQLENNLNGKVLVWMETRETEFSELETKWLSVTDLSDLELWELNSQMVTFGSESGTVSTKDRTVKLEWEKR
jgi:hypothetical protein